MRIWGGYLLVLMAWVVAVMALAFLGFIICASITWQPSPLYDFLNWVRDYIVLVCIVTVLAGWVVISFYFISKPIKQLDVVANAAEQLSRPSEEPIQLPDGVSFDEKKYPDVFGFIQIPNATQCAISKGHYLAQSPKSTKSSTGYDDDYYLQRDLDGKTNKAGSLYIQAYYNKSDLSDPMTVIYGHNMANRTMFGGLQSYGETLKFDDNAVMYIYQPGRQLTYKFFACIPYDTSHILYYHDFKDEKVFNAFFEALGKAASDPKYKSDTNQNAFYSAEGCVNVDKTNLPQAGDKVVVLSVCKNGDDHHRYLLMAKLVEDSAAPITMTRGEAEAAGIPADRIQDKAAADAAAAAANVSAVEDAAANKTDTASKTDTAKTEHKG